MSSSDFWKKFGHEEFMMAIAMILLIVLVMKSCFSPPDKHVEQKPQRVEQTQLQKT